MEKLKETRHYTTIVTDGSNEDVLNVIIKVFDDMTEKRNGEAICHPLDSDHPTTMVIETETNGKVYSRIERVIEKYFPGLCIFNPPIAI